MPGSMPRRPATRRVLVAVTLATWALVLPFAAPAAADPPRPGDYRSTVTGITPAAQGVEATVIGGDALVQLTVRPDHEVVVLGYDDEPYLQFLADGTVQENRNSLATYANASRYGEASVPVDLDEDARPDWRTVADGGRYSWHDHRIHWMSTQLPAGVERGSEVQRWEIPLVADGDQVTIHGVLVLEPAVAWWPWMLVIVAVAGLVWGLGRYAAGAGRRSRGPAGRQAGVGRQPGDVGQLSHGGAGRQGGVGRQPGDVGQLSRGGAGRQGGGRGALVAPVASSLACLLVAVVAGVEQLSFPAEAGRVWLAVVVPGVGLLAAVAAVVAARRSSRIGYTLGLVAAGLAAGTGALRGAVFTNPVLPTDLAPSLDRAGTAVSLGLAVGAAALFVAASRRQPAPTPSELAAETVARGD